MRWTADKSAKLRFKASNEGEEQLTYCDTFDRRREEPENRSCISYSICNLCLLESIFRGAIYLDLEGYLISTCPGRTQYKTFTDKMGPVFHTSSSTIWWNLLPYERFFLYKSFKGFFILLLLSKLVNKICLRMANYTLQNNELYLRNVASDKGILFSCGWFASKKKISFGDLRAPNMAAELSAGGCSIHVWQLPPMRSLCVYTWGLFERGLKDNRNLEALLKWQPSL